MWRKVILYVLIFKRRFIAPWCFLHSQLSFCSAGLSFALCSFGCSFFCRSFGVRKFLANHNGKGIYLVTIYHYSFTIYRYFTEQRRRSSNLSLDLKNFSGKRFTSCQILRRLGHFFSSSYGRLYINKRRFWFPNILSVTKGTLRNGTARL